MFLHVLKASGSNESKNKKWHFFNNICGQARDAPLPRLWCEPSKTSTFLRVAPLKKEGAQNHILEIEDTQSVRIQAILTVFDVWSTHVLNNIQFLLFRREATSTDYFFRLSVDPSVTLFFLKIEFGAIEIFNTSAGSAPIALRGTC